MSPDPSSEIATTSLSTDEGLSSTASCVSRTAYSSGRTGSKRRSAYRHGPAGVIASGGRPPWGSIDHSRPSENEEATMRPPSTRKEPPPYSWTRLRTLNGSGVSSRVAPSGVRRMSVRRPPSDGRPSIQ